MPILVNYDSYKNDLKQAYDGFNRDAKKYNDLYGFSRALLYGNHDPINQVNTIKEFFSRTIGATNYYNYDNKELENVFDINTNQNTRTITIKFNRIGNHADIGYDLFALSYKLVRGNNEVIKFDNKTQTVTIKDPYKIKTKAETASKNSKKIWSAAVQVENHNDDSSNAIVDDETTSILRTYFKGYGEEKKYIIATKYKPKEGEKVKETNTETTEEPNENNGTVNTGNQIEEKRFLDNYPNLKQFIDEHETSLKIGGGILATILVSYGLYKAYKAYKKWREGKYREADQLMKQEKLG